MASYPQNGITLKALLEIPFVMNPPQIQQNLNKVKEVDEEYDPFSGQSAFLGPTLWDHTLPYDANNLKLEYMDLDEFLQENGIPVAPDQGTFQLPHPNQPHQIQNSQQNPNHLPNTQNPNQLPGQVPQRGVQQQQLLQQLRQQLQQQQQLQQLRGNISPQHMQQTEQQPQQLHQLQQLQLQQQPRQQQQQQQQQQLRSNVSPQQHQSQHEPQHSPKQAQKLPALLSIEDIHPSVLSNNDIKTVKQQTPTATMPVPVVPLTEGHVKQEDDGTSTCSNCSLPELISPSPPQKSPTSVKSPSPSEPPSSAPPSAVATPSSKEDECDSGDETETESLIDDGVGEDGGQEDFDPKKRVFNDDDLRPQPMIKKSKKVFVPDEMKDTKYWMRRRKNNLAAKRSRDARRTKENQIIMRAAYLEHENDALHLQVEKMEKENRELRKKLTKYENTASS